VWRRQPDLRHVRNDLHRRRGLNRSHSRSNNNNNGLRKLNRSRNVRLKADRRLHLEAERAKARNHKTVTTDYTD